MEKLNRAGRRVVGVYDPEECSDGKDRLLACDVTEVVEAGADPELFNARQAIELQLKKIIRLARIPVRQNIPCGTTSCGPYGKKPRIGSPGSKPATIPECWVRTKKAKQGQ